MKPIVKANWRAVFALVAALALAPDAARGAATPKYPWNIPDNVRVVQPSPVDGVRTFATIQAALNSISGASATNRLMVKVMPGTYVGSLQMKDFVDLVGSGPENTILQDNGTSAISASNLTSFSIADLTIVQNSNGRGISTAGAGVSVTIRNVVVKLSGTATAGMYLGGTSDKLEMSNSKILSTVGYTGIQYGSSVLLSNSVIDMDDSARPGTGAVGIMARNVTLIDATISLRSSDWNYGVMADDVLTVTNSSITIGPIQARLENYGLYNATGSAVIQGSRINVTATSTAGSSSALYGFNFFVDGSVLNGSSYGLECQTNVQVNNSSVTGGILAVFKTSSLPTDQFRLGGSKLSGGHNLVAGIDKIVSCYDGNYNSIPNL